MTYREIRQTALRQSAVDCGCRPEDFLQERPVIVESAPNRNARKYLDLPFVCDLVSYGSNVVASIDGRYRELVAGYLERFPAEHCFETPALHVLDDAFRPHGMRVCYMAEYFLPDPAALRQYGCPYPLRLLGPRDFAGLYLPAWSNALCEKRKELDVLGVGAYDGERLVDRRGRTARRTAAGRGRRPYQPPDRGDLRPRQGALLLLCLGEHQVRPHGAQMRVPPRLGRGDGAARAIHTSFVG